MTLRYNRLSRLETPSALRLCVGRRVVMKVSAHFSPFVMLFLGQGCDSRRRNNRVRPQELANCFSTRFSQTELHVITLSVDFPSDVD